MKRALDTHEIEEILTAAEQPAPEPPENLLELLKEEIPQRLGAGELEPSSAGRRRPRYLIAATLFLAVVGAVVTYRVRDSLPQPAITDMAEDAARVEQQTLPSKIEPSGVEGETKREPEGEVLGEDAATSALTPPATSAVIPPASEAVPPQPVAPPVGSADVPKPRGAKSRAALDDGRSRGRRNESNLEDSITVEADGPEIRQSGAASATARTTPPAIEEGPARRLEEALGSVEAAVQEAQAKSKAVSPDEEVVFFVGGAPRRLTPDELRRSAEELRRRIAPRPQAPPSTGGTTEPNDQAYGDMFFRGYATNPFVDTEVDSLSTFGLDVDTGSYTMARSYIQRGDLPPKDAVRVEEFVNYFDYGDRPPRRGDFAIAAEGAPSPFTESPGYHLVRFGLHGREIARRDRKPTVLTFVVDVSGSMDRENRLGLVKRSLNLLLDELVELGDRHHDRVGLVIYGSRGEVVLEPSTDYRAVRRAIDALQPGGSTNAEEGLVLGYRMARNYFRHGAVNRVILCSDGVANVGRTGPESILERIEREAEFGIELTTVGFGMGNYNDVLMEQLADRGDGRYAYVDTLGEARRLFVDDLTGTLETIASDAKVQVEFDPRVVSLYRLVGYENRDIADMRFRDDSVDAGEIGAGHQVTAFYEIKLTDEAASSDRLAVLRLRYRSERSGRVEEESVRLAVRDLEPSWRAASPSLRLGAVVAEFAEILKGSYWARGGDLWALEQRARRLAEEFRGDPEVTELVDLIHQAARLGDSRGPRD